MFKSRLECSTLPRANLSLHLFHLRNEATQHNWKKVHHRRLKVFSSNQQINYVSSVPKIHVCEPRISHFVFMSMDGNVLFFACLATNRDKMLSLLDIKEKSFKWFLCQTSDVGHSTLIYHFKIRMLILRDHGHYRVILGILHVKLRVHRQYHQWLFFKQP